MVDCHMFYEKIFMNKIREKGLTIRFQVKMTMIYHDEIKLIKI